MGWNTDNKKIGMPRNIQCDPSWIHRTIFCFVLFKTVVLPMSSPWVWKQSCIAQSSCVCAQLLENWPLCKAHTTKNEKCRQIGYRSFCRRGLSRAVDIFRAITNFIRLPRTMSRKYLLFHFLRGGKLNSCSRLRRICVAVVMVPFESCEWKMARTVPENWRAERGSRGHSSALVKAKHGEADDPRTMALNIICVVQINFPLI